MIKKILGTLALLLVLLLAFAATRPDTFRVERSVSIKAPPEKVFSYLNDFQKFGAWSPWEKLDPAMQRTFSGPPIGVGSAYAWTGNNDVGAGRMEIKSVEPNARVTIQLDFLKPFEASNTTDYILQAGTDGATTVTWAMYGPAPYVSKLMGIFVSMDAMVGKDFEQGLANLKVASEK
jgi:uncharacterized protein YndB with AHSA1/START domain